jgi:hypothetical protein
MNSSIKNKRELFDFFQEYIFNAYRELKETNALGRETNLLKTFLIENDLKEEEDKSFYIKNFFILRIKGKDIAPKIIKTSEDDLIHLKYSNLLEVFIDTSDSRIWNLYSISPAVLVDKLVFRTTFSSHFDSLWLTHNFLGELQEHSIPRGFSLDYDFDKFSTEEISPSLKMQISGSKSTMLYQALQQHPNLRDQITLSKIKNKKVDEFDKELFILEDIKYNGKLTAKGNDISLHLSSISTIKQKYKQILATIESTYRFKWKSSSSTLSFDGEPIYIIKEGEPMDVDYISTKLFDGSQPFRLLGIQDNIPGGKSVEVLDLHINSTFTIQVFPDMFVFYLNESVCGNSIIRFFTNLQHAYANAFKVINDIGEDIII